MNDRERRVCPNCHGARREGHGETCGRCEGAGTLPPIPIRTLVQVAEEAAAEAARARMTGHGVTLTPSDLETLLAALQSPEREPDGWVSKLIGPGMKYANWIEPRIWREPRMDRPVPVYFGSPPPEKPSEPEVSTFEGLTRRIERAWMEPPEQLVDRLATEHPDHAEELYLFFGALVDSTAPPEKVERETEGAWIVWSHDRAAWHREGGQGYTTDRAKAGRFTDAEVKKWTGWDFRVGHNVPENGHPADYAVWVASPPQKEVGES